MPAGGRPPKPASPAARRPGPSPSHVPPKALLPPTRARHCPSPVTTAEITSPWRLQWNPASRRPSDTSVLSHASEADVGASVSSPLKGWGLPGARHPSLSGPGRPGCSLRVHCPGHGCSCAPSHRPAATGASTLAQPRESLPRGDGAQTDPQGCLAVDRAPPWAAHTHPCTHVHRHSCTEPVGHS